MLRFAEEILLLLLNDDNGKLIGVPERILDRAVAGATLMDLALENRIDTDLETLTLIDSTRTGDSLLDATLELVAAEPSTRDARYWVETVAARAPGIREHAFERLVARGILARKDDRMLWVMKSRRYPAVDGKTEEEVRQRIMGVLFSGQIPSPRDISIIALVDACDLFGEMLSRSDLEQATPRIELVSKLDLIGQAMSQAIRAAR